jgi:predicted RNA-binding protein with PIN domain
MRWLVDAMNLIGSKPNKWWNDPDRAMRDLARQLADFSATTGQPVTVVFDKRPREWPEVDGIEVVFARRKGRNAADYEIEQIVAGAEEPAVWRVVSSDKRLVEKVRELGGKVTSSGAFRKQMESATS